MQQESQSTPATPSLSDYTIPEEEALLHDDISIDMEVDWRAGHQSSTWDTGVVKQILDEGAYEDGMRYMVQVG